MATKVTVVLIPSLISSPNNQYECIFGTKSFISRDCVNNNVKNNDVRDSKDLFFDTTSKQGFP